MTASERRTEPGPKRSSNEVVLPTFADAGLIQAARSKSVTRRNRQHVGEETESEAWGGDADAVVHVGEEQLSQVPPRRSFPRRAGESVVGTGNTWEPTVAADPSSPYVYVMYNDFTATKACNTCPYPSP